MKILTLLNGRPTNVTPITVSAGAASAAQVFQTDATGKIDSSFMPVGVMADSVLITAFEALSAGDYVNIYSNAGTANVRRAQASSLTLEAHGYVLSAVAAAGVATVYYDDNNTSVTGLTPGLQFLSDTAFGKSQIAPPTVAGTIVQIVGIASSATAVHVRFGDSYTN